jgi:hypothetical protein
MKAIEIGTLTVFAAMTVAAGIALPASAQAGSNDFQSPTGNVYCIMGAGPADLGSVICQGGGGFKVPVPTDCHLAWGDRFTFDQGEVPVSHCHGDTIKPSSSSPGAIPNVAILEYGQTRSAGTITCDSESTGMTCTDASTGHYFRMARGANEIG